jgi:long-chain fatty acid transport protein
MRPALKSMQFAATALALSLTAMGQAHAAGFALMEQNASGLGNAYAGQAAAAEDASTVFFNPAGMTNIKGRQVVTAINAILPSSEFNDTGSSAPFVPTPLGTVTFGHPTGGDGGDAGDLAFVPNAYVSWELVPNQIWLGLGINAPFGLKTEYDDDWVGRFHATKSEVMSVNVNPTIAWKVNETFSVGGGINFQYFKADLRNQVSYSAAIFGQTLGTVLAPRLEGESTIEGDDWGVGWNIGAMFNLSPNTRIGLAYRSSIDFELEGDASFDDVPPIPLVQAGFVTRDITADVEVPESFSIGLSHYFTPRLQLLLDYTWTGWDSIQSVEIEQEDGTNLAALPLNFENSYRIGAGLNYQWSDTFKLRVGLAFDKTPVKDEFRTPRLPDEDRIWATIGAQWRLSPAAVVDVGYAYIWADEAEIDLPNSDPEASRLPRGNLQGDYDAHVQIFSVQMSYSF